MQRDKKKYTILDSASSTGAGKVIDVSDFRHCILSVTTANSANATIQFQGSIQDNYDDSLDFGSAQAVGNAWDYIEVYDLEDGSAIDGDTGISPAGTDDYRLFEVNINALRFLTANVTAHSAGNITVKALVFTN